VDAWLDGLIPTTLDRTGIPGATVAVVHEGKVLTLRGFGHAETGTGAGDRGPVPVDPDRHLFRTGSVSKLATATAALQLVQRGELDLDGDIREHLDFTLPLSFDGPVTLRHLLTHTAGFEERVAGLIGTGETRADLRRALVTDPPEQIYRPGTVPAYSNYGFALAGYLVQRVSGVPFEEYVQRNVLDRVGMTASTFDQPLPEPLRDRMAAGYPTAADPAAPFEIVGVPPAGSLTAPASDMARFMLAHLGENPGGTPLLDPATRELMQLPALGVDSLGTLAAGPRMTLGFFDESRNGRRILGHGGDTNYFHSHLQILPEEGAGIFVSVNGSGRGALDSLVLRQALTTGFADRYFPRQGERPAGTVDRDTAREHAALAAGSYHDSRGFRSTFMTVAGLAARIELTPLDDGRLLFTPGPLSDSPARYEEVSPWVWREVGGERTVAMRVTDGKVTAIGYDSAFALLPVEPARATGVVLPVLGGSLLILLLVVLSWPVRGVLRRVTRRPRRDPAGRTVRVLTRVAVGCALLALVGWVVTLLTIMGLQEVSTVSLRLLQVLQLVGLLGVLPAAVRLVGDLRRRAGWTRTVGSLAVLLALAGTGWFAVEFMLLAPSVSY
jgi:CubicO group peptidase (beta-lactamase class C family)